MKSKGVVYGLFVDEWGSCVHVDVMTWPVLLNVLETDASSKTLTRTRWLRVSPMKRGPPLRGLSSVCLCCRTHSHFRCSRCRSESASQSWLEALVGRNTWGASRERDRNKENKAKWLCHTFGGHVSPNRLQNQCRCERILTVYSVVKRR